MTRPAILSAAAAGAALILACTDAIAPNRKIGYDWRLLVSYDSVGPRMDTLSFHWPRTSIPVRIWVEDQFDLPARAREGIDLWRAAFLYGEWDATVVSDSNSADVIVRGIQAPPIRAGSIRLHGFLPSCYGATDVDTVATRFELAVPIRTYIYPSAPNSPNITQCLRRVTAHELGHSLGLFQHSTDTMNIMNTFPGVDELSVEDVGTVQSAYHYPVDMVPIRP